MEQAIPFFDEASSFGHAALGAALPFISPSLALSVAVAFLIYQVRESEPRANTVGDLGEFVTGYLGGSAIKGLR